MIASISNSFGFTQRGKLMSLTPLRDSTQFCQAVLISTGTSSSQVIFKRVASWKISLPGSTKGPTRPSGSKMEETTLSIFLLLTDLVSISLISKKNESEQTFHLTPSTLPWTLGDQWDSSFALCSTLISSNNLSSFTTNFVKLKPPSCNTLGVSWMIILASSLLAHECNKSST